MPSMLYVLQQVRFILFTLLMVFYALSPETGVAATRVVRRATSAEITSVSINGTSISSNNKIAKAGCKDRCGNISIPYPFGMDTSNCYRAYQFEIKCNYSSNPPIASIGGSWTFGNVYKVTEVTLDYVRIDTPVPAICDYDNITSTSSKMLDLSTNLSDISRYETPFTISNTLNMLTVIGCNIYGFVTPRDDFRIGSYDRSQDNNPIKNIPSSGCASICTFGYIGIPSPCVGNGCCKATIPNGLARFKLQVTRMIGHNMEPFFSPSTEPCIHAYVADHNFTAVGDMILSRDEIFVPLILEWALKDFDTCSKLHSGYACGKNTDCIEFHNGPGYRCKCSKGYQGNPYLQHGCQDIDECKEPHKCGSEALCTNTPGSYNCSCSPGKKLGISNLGYHCTPDKRRLPVAALVASGIGATIIVILMLGIGYWLYKRFEKRKQMKLKQKHFERNGGLLLKQKITSNDGKVEKAAKIFVTEELEKTTDNFNPSRIIGKGGFGTVYKGMLSGGEIVAIKKSTLVDENQVGQFINEVVILSQINHRHIVKLLGCCLETQVPLLVYEFVPNGTLSYHLQVEQEDGESLLSWKDRVRIASEIAGALAYLHSDASVPIFHRDIKSNNILLDEKYKAKVSDFGISRSIPIDKTHLTTLVQGTFGYLDPEYFHSCQFTDKSDVYSFGVVLVELLTGEQAISQIRHEEEKGLALYFIKSMKQNRLSETLDPRVLNEGEKDDVLLVAKLAKRCLKYVGKKRPTMKEVSFSLGALHEKLSRDSVH